MREKTKQLKNQVKGITLVALVVTIIILLILAGTAINLTLGEDGIFKKAGEGAQIYQNASKNEKIEIDKVSNYIDDYLNENKEEEKPIESTLGLVTGQEKTNTEVNDKYGNKVMVPAGFKVINPEASVLEGIVIEDISAGDATTKGNQYVWVPVGNVKTNTKGDLMPINLGRYTFESNGTETIRQSADDYTSTITIDTFYQELSSSSYGNIVAKNLGDFIIKTKNAGGYYIGRYEAGKVEGNTETFNVKEGQEVYNEITQPNAANLARNLYSSNSNFQSDLINSYAWDTAVVYIQTFSGDTDYSKQLGNNEKDSLQKTGTNILSDDNKLDVRCNIYDIAGNTSEWTTETYNLKDNPCTNRGGIYYYIEPYRYSASYRGGDSIEYKAPHRGFRGILYV